ncbi:extracellular solute-binding protein [Paenibacillus radicis (ex Xue et al. 2023)]|uniref:Extracellular solute-binding protein n=1 Tax=Paenibacillus radicis (ex Xue et al. 2023) TaxID=2972489 RepID=A0ABT1YV98_9BACL|nr:extracellular solute-binding protein [Paenibacillus radicis (ex Xue et al. 2023)]MCR8636879.1 extracellular solute-binding protein [Paenibacillus radicis (ex Xue et al. 2023)]
MSNRTFSALTLSVLFTASSVVAGCSSDNAGSTSAPASANKSTEPAAANTAAAGAKISEKQLTINGWTDFIPATGSTGVSSYSDQILWKEIEKRTNISVKWEITAAPGGDDFKSQLGLIMASGKLPDLIGHIDPLLADQYGRQGALQPLEDLIKKYAPNLQKIMDSNPAVKGQITSPDGHIYFFPRLLLDTRTQTFAGYMIRGDWLEKVGMKAPDTTDELYQVLKAFKEKDANGNGKTDEIPFTDNPNPIIWAFGVGSRGPNSTDDFFIEDGKIKYGPTDPRYKDALQYLNKLYSEGLLDPEYEKMKADVRDGRILQETSGFIYGSNAGYLTRFNKLLKGANKNPGFIALAAPKGPTGERNIIGKHNEIDPGRGVSIASTTKNAVEITKLMDYFYSKEGATLLYFGLEGDTYTVKDGVPTYTDKVVNDPKLDILGYLNTYVGFVSGWPSAQIPEHYLATLSDEGKKGNALAVQYAGKKKVPALHFTAEELNEVQTLQRDINTFIDENMNAFIRGKKSFSDYDSFQQGLKKIGSDKLAELYSKAYERYVKVLNAK